MKLQLLGLALLAASCTKGSGHGASDASGAGQPPTPATTATPAASSAPSAAGPQPMPSELNTSSVSVAGCLASPGGTEQGSRSRAMDTAPKKPELAVTVVGDGIQVLHDLSHACCLTSKIDTQVSDGVVTVTETLSGTPCRCMCSSTISASVRLAPGAYTLKVIVDENGQKKETEQKIVVK